MIDSKFLYGSLCALPGVILLVELFFVLPATRHALRILDLSKKAFSVMKSPNISDHWKEKVLPRYSRHLLTSSLISTLFIVILSLSFLCLYCLFGLLFIGDLNEVIDILSRIEVQIVTVVFGALYVIVRNRITKSRGKADTDYTFCSKVLHHISLSNAIIKEMAFDIDCMITKMQPIQPKVSSPVYIAGLARAGTTILLEALYATKAFTSLTYRNMPLITAPYLWSKITNFNRIQDKTRKERAHGDKIYVNFDSPEAFEEIFWMTFLNESYIKEDHLDVQNVDDEVVVKYRKYIQNILTSNGNNNSVRYLSKNNNNLLRIDTIKSAFDDAIIIVPFRNPVNHAKSLQNQHMKFLKTHIENPFSLKYMNWLGHFEFGANMKPFNVRHDAHPPESRKDPVNLEYWLHYWKIVYQYVLEKYASKVLFFNYDKFCEKPCQCLTRLESELSLQEGVLKQFSANISPSKKYTTETQIDSLPVQIKDVYQNLQDIGFF